jgi:hypothetical protein
LNVRLLKNKDYSYDYISSRIILADSILDKVKVNSYLQIEQEYVVSGTEPMYGYFERESKLIKNLQVKLNKIPME